MNFTISSFKNSSTGLWRINTPIKAVPSCTCIVQQHKKRYFRPSWPLKSEFTPTQHNPTSCQAVCGTLPGSRSTVSENHPNDYGHLCFSSLFDLSSNRLGEASGVCVINRHPSRSVAQKTGQSIELTSSSQSLSLLCCLGMPSCWETLNVWCPDTHQLREEGSSTLSALKARGLVWMSRFLYWNKDNGIMLVSKTANKDLWN